MSEARQDRRRSDRIRADWSGRFEVPGVALEGRIVDPDGNPFVTELLFERAPEPSRRDNANH